jgi:hypothetical protein
LQDPSAATAHRGIKPFTLLVYGHKDFLNHIFGLGAVPNDLVGQIQYGPKETQEEKVEAILAAVRDVVKHRFIREQSGMLVSCHFAVDYKRPERAQQGSAGQNIF